VKLLARRKSEQNRAAIDPWTAVHAGAGLALGLLEVGALPTAVLGVGYELVEQLVERDPSGRRLFGASKPESGANVAVDLAVYGLAWWLGRRWSRS
jgi:hypothetical protein